MLLSITSLYFPRQKKDLLKITYYLKSRAVPQLYPFVQLQGTFLAKTLFPIRNEKILLFLLTDLYILENAMLCIFKYIILLSQTVNVILLNQNSVSGNTPISVIFNIKSA